MREIVSGDAPDIRDARGRGQYDSSAEVKIVGVKRPEKTKPVLEKEESSDRCSRSSVRLLYRGERPLPINNGGMGSIQSHHVIPTLC